MTVTHHIDDATLMRYASGDLDEAFCVVVAAHIAMCETCRHAVHVAEEIGGALLDDNDEASLSAFAFDRLMQEIGRSGETILATPKVRAATIEAGDVPLPLRRYVGDWLAAISWKTVAPGVRKHAINLATSSASSLYMLHIGPGRAMPEHGHGGAETTLVLTGAYRDELGRFGPGDIADLDEQIEHQPRVEPGVPCICLVATEAPTRFKGLLARLFQPLVRI